MPPQTLRERRSSVLPLAGQWRFQITEGWLQAEGFYKVEDSQSATASSFNPRNPPASPLFSVDGNWWMAGDRSLPQWWQVDLERPTQVSALIVRFGIVAVATYDATIEGSTDQQTWTKMADVVAANGRRPMRVDLTGGPVRYLRVTLTGTKHDNPNAEQPIAGLRIVRVIKKEDGRESYWVPTLPAEQKAKQDAFAAIDFDDSDWSQIPVPSNWEMLGYSRPTYNQPDLAVGLYRRWVEVPKEFEGKTLLWHFDGVNNACDIFVNGQYVGYHESGMTAFDVDVTRAIKPGEKNLLALRVAKSSPSGDLDTGDYWSLGGIYRETFLTALPKTHVEDVTVVTDLDEQYRDATLKVAVQVVGSASEVEGQLFESDGTPVDGAQLSGAPAADGSVELTAPVTAPKLWSAEKPNLYYVVLTLRDDNGNVIQRVQERFGFREIEIRNSTFLWNGVPVKLKGVNRHEEYPTVGKALTEEIWRKDLTLMKAGNINAVRTSHYPHALRFMELCEEMGFYVLDEVPFCWTPTNDAVMQPAFMQRAKETLQRDKNFACVAAWSLGNEVPPDVNAQAVAAYVKAQDPTRPRFVSMKGPWNVADTNIFDMHYPSLEAMQRQAKELPEKGVPVVFSEQPHIFYTQNANDYDPGVKDRWVIAMTRTWDIIRSSDVYMGAFVWEWQDQSIADNHPDRRMVDANGLRQPAYKGMVDGYRNPKPEYYHMKMVYSPVNIVSQTVSPTNGESTVTIENRYDFTNLSELTGYWTAYAGERALESGDIKVDVKPNTKADVKLPAPSGMTTIRLEFIHPDGRPIVSARLPIEGLQDPAPPSLGSGGTLQVEESNDAIQIANSLYSAVIDQATGQISSWSVDGKELSVTGPLINLGERHGKDRRREPFIDSEERPQLKDVSVSHKTVGEMVRVDVTGNVHLPDEPAALGRLTYQMDFRPDGQVDFTWALDWTGKKATLWELGLVMFLPTEFDTMSWSRDTAWSDYPPDHIGAPRGTVKSDAVSFRSTKRDLHWASYQNGQGIALVVLPLDDKPLHVRSVPSEDMVELFLSSRQTPPLDFSAGMLRDLIITVEPGTLNDGTFSLRPARP